MQLGFLLIEMGSVMTRNIKAIVFKNFLAFCVVFLAH